MAKSAEEKAREWLDEQKRLPRPGSRFPIEPERAAAARRAWSFPVCCMFHRENLPRIP